MSLKLEPEKLKKYKEIVKKNIDNNFEPYQDPDTRIVQIVEREGRKYRLGPDAICGIKYLQETLHDTNIVIEYYQCIRDTILLWPRHVNSINIRRYRFFRDRIDFTLYDILNYYQKNKSKLIDTDSIDSSFFDSFGKKADGFYNFIEELGLEEFVDKKEKVVLNLGKEKKQPIESYEEYDNPVNNPFYLKNLYSVLGGSEIIDSSKS